MEALPAWGRATVWVVTGSENLPPSPMLTLTRDELRAITGAKRKSEIIRELRRRGWVFEIGKNGWAIVSSSYANQRLGASDARPSAWQPDFSKLRSPA